MVHSAFLPDHATLTALIGGMRATPRGAIQARLAWQFDSDKPDVAPTLPPPSAKAVKDDSSWTTVLLSELESRLLNLTSLDSRFNAFAGWLEECSGAESVFVADADGLGMVQSTAGETYVAAAAAIDSLRKDLSTIIPNVESGRTTLRPTSGSHVELIWCETALGRYTVGLVLAQPLGPAWTDAVLTALRDIVTVHHIRG